MRPVPAEQKRNLESPQRLATRAMASCHTEEHATKERRKQAPNQNGFKQTRGNLLPRTSSIGSAISLRPEE
jgi:hypothetical protein